MDLRSIARSVPVFGPAASALRNGRIGAIFNTIWKSRGVHPRTCPICGFHGRFTAFGDPPRWDARCPSCHSLERHRLLALLLKERPELVGGRTIHFAPEPAVTRLVQPASQRYETADLVRRDCDLNLNLEAISLPDQSVDTFVLSHLLEHVDDRKALAELYRCLRPGGAAVIMVPVVEGWKTSYENPAVTNERDRNLHFGQADHVRFYGADVRDRIREAGFVLEEHVASGEDSVRFGLRRGESVFVAIRPRAEASASVSA